MCNVVYFIIIKDNNWMGWIFDACTDVYGSCIRQYVNFALCLIVVVLAFYSSLRTYQTEKIKFELLPLIINTISSLILLVLYSQMEVYNIRIVLLIIEIYSYFILCYSFVFMVLKANIQNITQQKTIKQIFYIISVLVLLGIITTFVLSLSDVITCQEDQGLASIVVVCLQFPLLIVTFVYSSKSKKLILDLQNILRTKREQARQTQHLIDGDDTYIELKLMQLKYIRFAFIISLVLHLIQLSCYYIGNEQIICLGKTNKVQITNALQLYILCIENLSELFPHFIVPFIFWYIPAKIYKQNGDLFEKTYYEGLRLDNQQQINNSSPTSKNLNLVKQESNLVPDLQNQTQIRQKLIYGTNNSPNRKTM